MFIEHFKKKIKKYKAWKKLKKKFMPSTFFIATNKRKPMKNNKHIPLKQRERDNI